MIKADKYMKESIQNIFPITTLRPIYFKKVFNYDYEFVIDNSGTLDELKIKAKDFLNSMED